MHIKVDTELLLEAAKSHLVSFDKISSTPVVINKIFDTSGEFFHQIVERYNQWGFAVIHIVSDPPSPESLISLADAFELGEPFIPPLYTKGSYKAQPIAKISAQHSSTSHPTFQHEVGVKLHCDGTLQKIGHIKTSVLYCEVPGTEGGENILFNTTAAYAELVEKDLDAAIAMATHGSLVRQANMNGCSDKNIGPVFSVEDGKLICAYSVTETDKFVATQDIDVAALSRAVEHMQKLSQPGSPYYCQVKLEANEALMLANTKISHGRTPYHNSLNFRRCLYRGLFLNYPKAIT